MRNKLLQAQILTISMIAMLVVFELFSYSSDEKGMMYILGRASWSVLLAFSLCAIDFAGLARLFLPDASDLPQGPFWMLAGAWLLTAVWEMFLTYIVIADHMTVTSATSTLVQAGIITYKTYTTSAPIFFAVLEWLIQCTLVVGLNKGVGILLKSRGDNHFGGGGGKYKPQHKPKFGGVDRDEEVQQLSFKMMQDE